MSTADVWDVQGVEDPASEDRFEHLVGERMHQLEVDVVARERHAALKAGERARPRATRLTDFLARDFPDPTWRIDDLLSSGANAMIVAQYKAGKSTLVGNLVRSLADGTPFLGTYPTRPGPVVLIDDELDEQRLQQWLRDQGIRHPENVSLFSLRGRVSSFDILDATTRAMWADAVREMTPRTLIFDCLRPVLDGLGLSEDKDAGRFLTAFDALKYEAGVRETAIVHHMGHNGERSRGDSRLLDWPDVTWKIIREQADDPASRRYFSAFGRDVDVSESMLDFDSVSRHLTLVGGSRQQARAVEHVDSVVEVLRAHDSGMTQNALVRALGEAGVPRDLARQVPKIAASQGLCRVDSGPNRALVYTLLPAVGGGERK